MLDRKGRPFKVGDSVNFENGNASGVIKYILESDSDVKMWAVEEKGLMIESKPFGMVFLPISCIIVDEVQIVPRDDVANGDKY